MNLNSLPPKSKALRQIRGGEIGMIFQEPMASFSPVYTIGNQIVALATRPKILVADEPTTALDVTIQAQIIELIKDLQKEFSMSVIFITHDMGLIARVADAVAVMYSGIIVERGPTEDLIREPKHPYTRGLLDALPMTSLWLPRSPPGWRCFMWAALWRWPLWKKSFFRRAILIPGR